MSLTMLHLPLDLPAIMTAGREHDLVRVDWAADLGYLVHALLARLFDGEPPRPFDVQPAGADGRRVNVLAYTSAEAEAKLQRAKSSSDTAAANAVDWSRVGLKPMPMLEAGRELGFRVRVCPTIRVGKQHPAGFGHGAELDPYQNLLFRELAARGVDAEDRAARDEVAAALPTREEIYRQWLAERLGEAAELREAGLTALADARLWRRGVPSEGASRRMHGHPRRRGKGAVIGRRDAVFEGTLRITDAAAFTSLLARGVGRHRAFGFGMLLLRPCEA